MKKKLDGIWSTPIGEFKTLVEASKALQVVRMTVRRRCLLGKNGYSFKPTKGSEDLLEKSKIQSRDGMGRPVTREPRKTKRTMTEDHKKKIGAANKLAHKNKKRTEEHKSAISEAMKKAHLVKKIMKELGLKK